MERLPSLRSLQLERLPSIRSLHQARRNSFNNICVCLKATDLLKLITELSSHCRGGDDFIYCDQLQKSLRQGSNLGCLNLDEVSCFLEDFVSSNSNISSELAVDVHSCIGLILERLGSVDRAIRSLLRALWIQEKLATTNEVAIAITEHRLGLAYAKVGDYRKSVHLLEKALVAYGAGEMKAEHTCIQDAEESLREFRRKQVEQELEQGPLGAGNLTDIFEEGPIPAM